MVEVTCSGGGGDDGGGVSIDICYYISMCVLYRSPHNLDLNSLH